MAGLSPTLSALCRMAFTHPRARANTPYLPGAGALFAMMEDAPQYLAPSRPYQFRHRHGVLAALHCVPATQLRAYVEQE